MKVILLDNIKKIGKKYEIKNVSDGYARNFLIPRGLVKIADDKNLEWLKDQLENIDQKAEAEFEAVSKLASNLDGLEIEIAMKIGDKGQLFKKIDKKDIIKKLAEMGYKLEKKNIEVEPIKEMGEYPINIKLDHNLQAEIKLIITEE